MTAVPPPAAPSGAPPVAKPLSENPLVVRLRNELVKRGGSGIKGISMYFRQIDDDSSKTLTIAEFTKGLYDHNIIFTKDESAELFRLFDKNQSGTLDFDEFLNAVRPPVSNSRMSLIYKAFEKLDKTKDGQVTVEDLKGVYNVKSNAKYLSGEWSEEQVLKKFLEQFEIGQHKNGVVTLAEFIDYYTGVSASIDNDAYFSLMMANSWKI